MSEEQKTFIAKFLTYAIISVSLEWIARGMKEDPAKVADQVNIIIKGDLHKALKSFEEENQQHS